MDSSPAVLKYERSLVKTDEMWMPDRDKKGTQHAPDKSIENASALENGETVYGTDHREENLDERVISAYEEQFPIDQNAQDETQQFTIRAVVVGCCLGGVICASNIYLGLKTGWTFGAGLFGAIFGFGIFEASLSSFVRSIWRRTFPTAAGSLGLLFTSGFPAAYQLGLLTTPKQDFGKLITFTLACAYYGMFFAQPLRKFYILKQKLTFPSAVAAALTIRSLHTGKNAEVGARKKTQALAIAFGVAITWRCVSEYTPGVLWDWHWGWTQYRLGWKHAIEVENWSWAVEFTPAFTAVGFLVGRNVSYSFFGGSIHAWGVIGPSLVAAGVAFGEAVVPDTFPEYMNYMSMALEDPVNQPSPRYWLVWPGTMLLVAGSIAELVANYKTFYTAIAQVLQPVVARLRRKARFKFSEDDLIAEPCSPSELVPAWMWAGGVVLSIVFTCIIMSVQFEQNVGVTILAILFAFLFSFIGAETCGRTNIIPAPSIGNASQLVIGRATHGHSTIQNQQMLNLTGGLLALGASEQATSMLSDLKAAHLLRAAPRVQFYAQCCGAIVAVFMSVSMFVLFATAYPCIIDLSQADKCTFSAPDVGAWRAIATAVTSTSLPIPKSSAYFSLVVLVYAFVHTFIKIRFVPERYHRFVPNLIAIGMAMLLNTTTYPTAMAIGATIAFFWNRNNPAHFAMYGYAIAAGMIAGEGLGGLVGAVLQIAGVSGSCKGTAIGCPAMIYCG